MADSFLLEKNAKSIVNSLKNFIKNYECPNEFSTDNGREFVN